jgi:type II secretory pathway component PulF
MPRFRVIATSPDGATSEFELDAVGPEAAAAAVEAPGVTVVSIEPIAAKSDRASAYLGTLSHEEARDFAQHLSGLAQAGLPLPSGLRALQAELPRGTLAKVIGELADRLESGEPLDESLRTMGNRFPAHLRGLVLSAVRTGRIDKVLGEFVNYSQVGASLRRSLWLTLSYPVLMVIIYVTIFGFLSLYVIEGFRRIFADFGIDLPFLTRQLLYVSQAINSLGLGFIYGPFVAIAIIFFAGRVLLDPPSRARIVASLPLFGALWRWTALAEFSHYLALLLECEIPLGTAVPLAADGARDPVLKHAAQGVVQEIASGQSLAQSVAWWRVFPAGFAKILRWAEGHQSLPETLHMSAEMFEARARSQASFIGSVVAVVSIILILWGCAFVVVALFLPLITLISKLT